MISILFRIVRNIENEIIRYSYRMWPFNDYGSNNNEKKADIKQMYSLLIYHYMSLVLAMGSGCNPIAVTLAISVTLTIQTHHIAFRSLRPEMEVVGTELRIFTFYRQ